MKRKTNNVLPEGSDGTVVIDKDPDYINPNPHPTKELLALLHLIQKRFLHGSDLYNKLGEAIRLASQ